MNLSLQDVEASSPAALAGFYPHSDYIVGADQVLQDVRNACFHHHKNHVFRGL